MARYPGATWLGPVPNQGGQMGAITGLVLHIQEGTEAGTDAWFHNPASKVSAHFGNPKAGRLQQWVDTTQVAWAEVDGNTDWISLENEGNSGDTLTASQLENAAELLAWLHATYDVPLQISNNPSVPGLSGHSIGGAAWGGHADCPGAPILAQRPQIVARAAQIAGAPNPGGTAMPTVPPSISQRWPQLAGDFPPNAAYTDDSAIIWADAGARAAALFAGEARDAANAMSARLDELLARPALDTAGVATAVASHLACGGGATADEIEAAIAAHLTLTVGSR